MLEGKSSVKGFRLGWRFRTNFKTPLTSSSPITVLAIPYKTDSRNKLLLEYGRGKYEAVVTARLLAARVEGEAIILEKTSLPSILGSHDQEKALLNLRR